MFFFFLPSLIIDIKQQIKKKEKRTNPKDKQNVWKRTLFSSFLASSLVLQNHLFWYYVIKDTENKNTRYDCMYVRRYVCIILIFPMHIGERKGHMHGGDKLSCSFQKLKRGVVLCCVMGSSNAMKFSSISEP